jgi:hypothetical protein
MICHLEVSEDYIACSFSDCTITTCLVAYKVFKNGRYQWVFIVRSGLSTIKVSCVVWRCLAWVSPWDKSVENSQTVLSVTVRSVVPEFTEFLVLGANVRIIVGSNSGLLHVEPETVSISTSNGVVNKDVVSVSDPPRSRCLVSVQETV